MSITEAKRKRALNTAIKWLVKLQSPNLSRARQIDFFDWLASSPVHQAAYLEAEQLWERGKALNEAERLEEVPEHRFFSGWQVAACTGICILALGCLVFLRGYKSVEEVQSYQTALGEQKKILLADGSKLVLNTNTSIRVQLDGEERVVYLDKGEVFFNIEPIADRPFDVVMPKGIVRVLGTQFSVYKSDERTLVTVVEGKVGLAVNKKELPRSDQINDSFYSDATLTANQRLTLEAAVTGELPEKVDASAALAWRNRQLIYRGDNLGYVVRDLNRYFNVRIRLDDQSMEKMKVVAVIQFGEVKDTLAALADSLNLTVRQRKETNEFILQAKQ